LRVLKEAKNSTVALPENKTNFDFGSNAAEASVLR